MAYPGYYFRFRISKKSHTISERDVLRPIRIEILIPAFNEAEFIGSTLTHIQCAVDHFRTESVSVPAVDIAIRVAADGSTDQTAEIAPAFSQVSVTAKETNAGKWATLNGLLSTCRADWVILVDAGTLWPENFLTPSCSS